MCSQHLTSYLSGTALMSVDDQPFDIHGLHAGHSYRITVSGVRAGAEEDEYLWSAVASTLPKAPAFNAQGAVTVDEHSITLNGMSLPCLQYYFSHRRVAGHLVRL